MLLELFKLVTHLIDMLVVRMDGGTARENSACFISRDFIARTRVSSSTTIFPVAYTQHGNQELHSGVRNQYMPDSEGSCDFLCAIEI